MTEEPDRPGATKNGWLVLIASCLLTLVLGSVHAFSVFLQPMEQTLGATRAEVSFTYSFALVCLTMAVLAGHLAYGKLRPPVFAAVASIGAAIGCVVAGQSSELWGIWLGYSVIFGTANGFGYGFALQIAAQANPAKRALAIGIVTACYALGAAVFPGILTDAINHGGIEGALNQLAAVIAVAGCFAAVLMRAANAEYISSTQSDETALQAPAIGLLSHLWFAYGAGVSAGLMVIGHATGIARSAGAPGELVVQAAIFVAVGNMAGGIAAGWLTDRIGTRLVLSALPLLSVLGLSLLLLTDDYRIVLVSLGLTGFAYGAIIAVYPAAISYLFGSVAGVKVYGRVFTAWGTAGLIFPWLAGFLFDQSSSYTLIFVLAAIGSLMSAMAASRLPDAGTGERQAPQN